MLQSGEPVVASLSRSALQGTGESSQAANERRDGAPFQRWANSDFHTLFFFCVFFSCCQFYSVLSLGQPSVPFYSRSRHDEQGNLTGSPLLPDGELKLWGIFAQTKPSGWPGGAVLGCGAQTWSPHHYHTTSSTHYQTTSHCKVVPFSRDQRSDTPSEREGARRTAERKARQSRPHDQNVRVEG